MKVSEIMHKGVEWVSPDTPVTTLARKMQQHDVGALPVGENDRLVGIVTDRDIAVRGVADGKDIAKLTARDIMTKGVTWCRASDTAHAAHLMEGRLPGIDDNKRMVGMLALGDISHATSHRIAAEIVKAVSAHHV